MVILDSTLLLLLSLRRLFLEFASILLCLSRSSSTFRRRRVSMRHTMHRLYTMENMTLETPLLGALAVFLLLGVSRLCSMLWRSDMDVDFMMLGFVLMQLPPMRAY